MKPSPTMETFLERTRQLQADLVAAFQEREPEGSFAPHRWEREGGAGGGTSQQLRGEVLERASIGHSHVWGEENPLTGRPFHGGGVSLIVHPANPHAPAVHMNLRRFEEVEEAWFGGVVDLNPMGLDKPEDTEHFHRVLERVCQAHDRPYETYAEQCDEYFWIRHRQIPRGVGGIFFDRLDSGDLQRDLDFVLALGQAFSEAYFPLLDRRVDQAWTEQDRATQLRYRGYYVEFNLVQDVGTRFGFESDADPEAYLSSLPPLAAW